jgi:hypothetical protein
MGNPLLDISSDVDQSVLDKYDMKLDSAILAEEKHMPLYTELTALPGVQYIAGGATQNSIRVAQWMIGEAGSSAFMGCIGKDEFGSQLANCAKEDGVYTHYMIDEATPTGTCAVLVSGGERSLCANLAAANNFKEEHLETKEAQVRERRALPRLLYFPSPYPPFTSPPVPHPSPSPSPYLPPAGDHRLRLRVLLRRLLPDRVRPLPAQGHRALRRQQQDLLPQLLRALHRRLLRGPGRRRPPLRRLRLLQRVRGRGLRQEARPRRRGQEH